MLWKRASRAPPRRVGLSIYRRPPLPDFPYNLYAMVHGHSEEEVRRTVVRMADETGLAPFDVLFSAREFKKVSMRYFEEDATR